MTIRGILFDKDGTLLDFNATWLPANRAAALVVAGGDKILAARLLDAGGQNDATGTFAPDALLASGNTAEIADFWSQLVPDHGVDDLVGAIDGIFQGHGRDGAVAVPGMAATISRLQSRGLKLGIATSDSHQGVLASLAAFDVLKRFDFIAGYDSGLGHKPEPGMVVGFCAATELSPAEVMVVGDNRHDLEMGRRAGVGLCIGVLTGTSSRDHLSPLADHVIDSIAAIESLL